MTKEILEAAEKMRTALQYGKNEMKYRIHQIEGGYNIPLTGEMHRAVEMADEALVNYETAVRHLARTVTSGDK